MRETETATVVKRTEITVETISVTRIHRSHGKTPQAENDPETAGSNPCLEIMAGTKAEGEV